MFLEIELIEVPAGPMIRPKGRRIRLFGIYAPELSQTCTRSGESWTCGESAKQKLEGLASNREIICKAPSTDAFRREVATCNAGGRDLGDAMVPGGIATAFRQYSTDYIPAEEQARRERAGSGWRV